MKNKYFLVALAFIAILAAAFWILRDTATVNTSPKASQDSGQVHSQMAFAVDHALLVREHSPALGPAVARVTVVEFLDPECEACRAMYPKTKKILEEFSGKVKFVVRYMPFHQNSLYAANILESARKQDKYWEALELMFKRQPEWADHHDPRPENILVILSDLKIDTKKLDSDAKAGKFSEQIKKDEADGRALGVRLTPTYFINGKPLEEMSEEALRAAISAEL